MTDAERMAVLRLNWLQDFRVTLIAMGIPADDFSDAEAATLGQAGPASWSALDIYLFRRRGLTVEQLSLCYRVGRSTIYKRIAAGRRHAARLGNAARIGLVFGAGWS